MVASVFKKADRRKKKLRLALDGPAGSGKTLTALRLAMVLARHEAEKAGRPGQTRVAVIDTENGSASIYQGDVYDGFPIEFDVIELSEFSPTRYSEITREAARLGYDVLIIDSLSHAWSGKGGALELVDRAADKVKGNTFAGWKDITPLQTEMIETIIRSSCHVFVTMRTKTEWVLELNERGKQVPRKVGMAPVQRSGVEYEFDVVLDIDEDHIARVTKSRCSAIADKASSKPGAEFMGAVVSWLDHGSDIPQDVLDRAALVDAPADRPGEGVGAGAKPADAPVSIEDQAARMAKKKAEREAAAGKANGGTTTAAPVTAPVQSSPLVEKAPETATATTTAGTMPVTATPTGPLATPAQQLEITTYFNVMAIPPEGQADTLKKRGANSVTELTETHATDLLTKLRGLPSVDHAAVIKAGLEAATKPSPVVTKTVDTGPAMITGVQQDHIRNLCERLQIPHEARVMAYQKRGAVSLQELTSAAADDLLASLVTKFPPEQQREVLRLMELEHWADRIGCPAETATTAAHTGELAAAGK